MKKILFILIIFFNATISNAQKQFVVDPDASLRTVSGSFTAIKVSAGIDLYLSQSDDIAVAVSAANEDIKAGIKTFIENGVLSIFYDGEKTWKKKDRKLRVYVSFTELKKIEASGSCDVVIAGSLTAENLELRMSGSCDFNGMVKAGTLTIRLSGSSDIYISGTANTVDIESTGASDVHGYDLVTDYCNANASGASDVHITVNKELNAQANGASDIFYKGKGVIKESQSSNSSTIEKKN